MGFVGSKNVKVVTVWEVLVTAGASLHLDLCRVRSKFRVTCDLCATNFILEGTFLAF